jgi:alpha-mannosidase
MDNKIVHVISHSHWDREWYLPFEKHRARLVRLMDTLLDVLERDPEFRSFHLDGQTIVLDDYLEVRPDMRERIKRLAAEGRLVVGPWYVLQDEFLTSGEANVRNLLIGHQDARRFGNVAKIGYFPDSFGNMGQAPQLLRQAGIDTAVFGRGVKPTGFNNETGDTGGYESPYSEMIWRSPDGSEVLGILFANWYHNGMEIPADPAEAKSYWESKLDDAGRYASTPHWLLMNGCDHQPVQTDLSQALRTARELYPDIRFIHSDFPQYADAVRRAVPDGLTVIEGELRSQRTDGWGTLVNTASSRVYLKQANQYGQTLLENVAEPLAALASALRAAPYPHALLRHAWKTLMQNHPHDSICGCSIDEVHREMTVRFARSRHAAEAVAEESARAAAEAADTSGFAAWAGARPFVVFNTTGKRRSGTVAVRLELARAPLSDGERAKLETLSAGGRVIDASGRPVAAGVRDMGVRFGYELPDDRFRQPYWARVVEIELHARDVPALGFDTYAWIPDPSASADDEDAGGLLVGERTLENAHIRVKVEDNGTLTLLDRRTGRVYRDLCEFEDVGDIGNEYVFRQPDGDRALRTGGLKAEVAVVESTAYRAVLEIRHDWEIPASADERLEVERERMVPFRNRQAQRSDKRVPLRLRTRVTLEKDAREVQVAVSFENEARDHRLRVLLPSDIASDSHVADSVFEIARRPNEPAPEWTNPSNCQHLQAFVAVDDAEAGLMAACRGLHEYELLRDGRNTIAVTLVRSVGEMGDWGVFPTPEAQCLGRHTAEFSLIPYGGEDERCDAANVAYQSRIPWTVRQTGVHGGGVPPRMSLLAWEGRGMALTAVKRSEETDDLIVRWVNLSTSPTRLTAELSLPDASSAGGAWYRSNVLEEVLAWAEAGAPASFRPGISADVRPAEIVTLGCRQWTGVAGRLPAEA